ncbi:MAG: SAM-dependent chlorinase/fluorinase [Thermodesulfobacteriota bacterium]
MDRCPPVITLLTDFGLEDEYVGVMKGVVFSICRHALVVDISHSIPPQNVLAAAAMIEASYRFFPEKTIHVLVVDPGVGTERRLIALQVNGHTFLAPDNGILTPFLVTDHIADIRAIAQPLWYLSEISSTFHGRDILAPVAAHLAAGEPFSKIGPVIDPASCIHISLLRPSVSGASITGTVVHVDRFGNLVTNIARGDLERLRERMEAKDLLVRVGGSEIVGIRRTYGNAPSGTVIAVIGSRERLEIAVACGNASRLLQVAAGATVIIQPTTDAPSG